MSRRKANLEDHVAEDAEDCVAEDAGPLLKKARLEEDHEEEPSIWQQEKAREIIEYCKKSVTGNSHLVVITVLWRSHLVMCFKVMGSYILSDCCYYFDSIPES